MASTPPPFWECVWSEFLFSLSVGRIHLEALPVARVLWGTLLSRSQEWNPVALALLHFILK